MTAPFAPRKLSVAEMLLGGGYDENDPLALVRHFAQPTDGASRAPMTPFDYVRPVTPSKIIGPAKSNLLSKVVGALSGAEDLQNLGKAVEGRDVGGGLAAAGWTALAATPIAIPRRIKGVKKLLAGLREEAAAKGAAGVTLDAKTLKPFTGSGYMVGSASKSIGKDLTEEAVAKVTSKLKKGQHLGIWFDPTSQQWFVEPSDAVETLEEAMKLGVKRNQIAIGNIRNGSYLGDIAVDATITPGASAHHLIHVSPIEDLQVIDPAFAGTGPVRGAERNRAGRIKTSHFFLDEPGRVEAAFDTDAMRTYYLPDTQLKLYDLAEDPLKLRSKAKDASDLERKAKAAGYDGLIGERRGDFKRTVTTWKKVNVDDTDEPFLSGPSDFEVAKRLDAMYPPAAPKAAQAPAILRSPLGADPSLAEQADILNSPQGKKAFLGKEVKPESEGALFDYKGFPAGSVLKDVAQRPIPRPAGPLSERGLESQRKRLKVVEKRFQKGGPIDALVARGVEQGAHEWYITDPIADWFTRLFGEQQGIDEFTDYMRATSASSPSLRVPAEIRTGTAIRAIQKQGLDPRTMIPGTGSLVYGTHKGLYKKLSEGIDLLEKVGGYHQPKVGNFDALAADRHFVRSTGLPGDKLRPEDYQAVEDIARSGFERMADDGILPRIPGRATLAPGQSALWVGNEAATGLYSSTAPFARVLEDRVVRTAGVLGISPQDLFRRVMEGKGLVFGLPLAAGAGAMASQRGGSQ